MTWHDPDVPVDDPLLTVWTDTRRPPIRRQHRLWAQLQHAAALDELDRIDDELETLSARRRLVGARLGELRPRLWPNRSGHHRRRPGVDQPPFPPVPVGAAELWGRDLRATCLAVLRRHGPLALRELHGLLHRYGYQVPGPRAVQRLGDALGYEADCGRCERVRRGVYRATGRRPDPEPHGADLTARPLRWTHPDTERERPDVAVADDPARWSRGDWPDDVDRVDRSAPAVDAAPAASVAPEPADGELLDAAVGRARRRLADLVRSRITAGGDGGRPASGSRASSEEVGDLFEDHWGRFAVESVPEVRQWLAKGERWPWGPKGSANGAGESGTGTGPPEGRH